jgi:hypothetical protein
MRSTLKAVIVSAVFAWVSACSSEYILSTNDGTMITTDGKPRLDEKTGMYTYKDTEGRKGSIKKEDVKQILER